MIRVIAGYLLLLSLILAAVVLSVAFHNSRQLIFLTILLLLCGSCLYAGLKLWERARSGATVTSVLALLELIAVVRVFGHNFALSHVPMAVAAALFPALVLLLLTGRKERMVFSPEYRRVVAAAPEIRFPDAGAMCIQSLLLLVSWFVSSVVMLGSLD